MFWYLIQSHEGVVDREEAHFAVGIVHFTLQELESL
jgi:hypothetical protein